MRTGAKKDDGRFILDLVVIVVLIAFIIASFLSFTHDNSRRVLEQNDSFIEAATVQMADRLNELIDTSQRNVKLLAHLYGPVMTGPEVDPAMLRDMSDRSPFDYVEFISREGIDLTAEGETADLSDRSYFQDGMRGNSGKCVIYNSRITHETLLIFYAPFYYEDQIVGVLSGILRGDTLESVLSTDYFGLQGRTYLLERDGSVIFSVGDPSSPEDLVEHMKEHDQLAPEDLRKLEEALDRTNGIDSNSFNYEGAQGEGSAYVVALEEGEWVLVQSLPSAVTKTMTESANSAGIRLQMKLAAAFVAYMLYIIFKNRRQKRLLVSEKQEMSSIVDTVTQLFTRFSLVDLETDTYQYLEDKCGDAPQKGDYSDLIRYLDKKYVQEVEDGERMSVRISPDYIRQHLTEEVPYLQFEYQIDMEGLRWENNSILCLKRKKGIPVSVLCAIQDVTALKEQEAEIRLALKSASEAAEAASHAKSDFLARMSHDIRTPMNAIMGMTAVAAMHLDDQERLTDCLSKITISSRHLLALINDVLDMSKIESGKVSLSEEPFGIADMVDSVMTIVKAQVESKRQQLKVHISDIVHEDVIGDSLRLRQIFVNILGNAVKFTPEGGTITFSIRELTSTVHGMACYEFVSEDTGIGMDEAFLKTIFDPFSRSERPDAQKIEGTGLGMSITRNIVRMMEGDIQVESKLGVGSKFTVQIHLKLQDLEAEDISELTDLKILVADDDQSSCVTTCETLESIGMEAEWVLSGDEAVERTVAADAAHDGFAAVILDWKMPGKDGLETAHEIREKVGDGVPIIILSAYDWSDIEAEAREAGIQAFIEKPLFRSRLVYALKSVLAQSGQKKELATMELDEVSDHSGKRVLLVEDNELNREIAGELLSAMRIEVEQARDGQEAVEMVEKSPLEHYDLIFMDVQMPVMDGYEATRRIRRLERTDATSVPIIAMTANAFADDIREAKEAGMDDHMSKPVEIAKLLEVLDKWLH